MQLACKLAGEEEVEQGMASTEFPFHVPENQLPKDRAYYEGLDSL
jgi:hypothetical protein